MLLLLLLRLKVAADGAGDDGGAKALTAFALMPFFFGLGDTASQTVPSALPFGIGLQRGRTRRQRNLETENLWRVEHFKFNKFHDFSQGRRALFNTATNPESGVGGPGLEQKSKRSPAATSGW